MAMVLVHHPNKAIMYVMREDNTHSKIQLQLIMRIFKIDDYIIEIINFSLKKF